MAIFATINGINDSADHTVNRIGNILAARGHAVTRLTYVTRRWWETRNRQNQYLDAVSLYRQLPKNKHVNLIAHSWGVRLGELMIALGGSHVVDTFFAFAPALDNNWVFTFHGFQRMHVIHNEHDCAVLYARLLFRGWHPWGDMGRVGYRGTDSRIKNIKDTTKRTSFFDTMHCHYFEPPHLERWVAHIEASVQ